MSTNDMIKAGTLIGGIIGAWLFLNTHFSTVEAMEGLTETTVYIRIDILDTRLQRLQEKENPTLEDEAMIEKYKRELSRLEKQLEKHDAHAQ